MVPTGMIVYDDAFSPAASKRLADISTLGSYRRSRGAHTATEHFIESLLHELGEVCDEVEYWGRERWRPVCAHADIDERCARERGQLRFPAAVLVAYVQVEPELRAPTVLWAELPSGAPVLCAVPAVSGRLLRFDGEMLHAVPPTRPLTRPHARFHCNDTRRAKHHTYSRRTHAHSVAAGAPTLDATPVVVVAVVGGGASGTSSAGGARSGAGGGRAERSGGRGPYGGRWRGGGYGR